MALDLLRLQRHIEPHLAAIGELFVPEVRLTLIARLPGNNEADVVLTIDDPDKAIKALERRKEGLRGRQAVRPW